MAILVEESPSPSKKKAQGLPASRVVGKEMKQPFVSKIPVIGRNGVRNKSRSVSKSPTNEDVKSRLVSSPLSR